MAEYKIDLGVQLNKADLGKIKTDINNIGQQKKITLDIDRKNVDKHLDSIRKQIKNLSNIKVDIGGNGKSGTGNVLNISTADVSRVTQSFEVLEKSIKDIRNVLGSMDNASGMESILSTINKINRALEDTSNEFKELNANLKSLSSKDFSINFDLKMSSGKNPVAANAAYGQKVRNETLPQLKQQYQQIAEYVKKVKGLKSDWESTAINLALKSGGAGAYELLGNMGGSASLSKQMDSYKQMIAYMKKAASMDGIDLSSVTASFSKSADELISDAQRVQSGIEQAEKQAEETKQQFKGLFGSGIDSEALNAQLDSIVNNLTEIKSALQSLSANNTIDGLTQSFNGLSQTLEKLIKNAGTFKQAMNTGVSGSTNIGSSVAKAVKNVSNTLKAAGKQGGKELTNALETSVESNLNLDEIIAREAHAISSFLEFDKYLEPDKAEAAIKEISTAISDYVKNVKVAIGNTEELGDDITYLARSNGINKIKDTVLKSRGGSSSTSDIDQSYLDVYDYVKNYNKKGYKVNIPESIRQREDYNSMRRKLGAAFTSGSGTDLETFIQQLNEEKGEIIDLSIGIDSAFDQLYDAVQRGKSLVKSGKSSGGIDIIDDIPKNELSDVYALIEAALNNIEEYQKKVADVKQNLNQSASQDISVSGLDNIEDDVTQLVATADNAEDAISQIGAELSKLGVKDVGIESITKDITELGIEVQKVTTKIRGNNLELTIKGVQQTEDGIQSVVTEVKKYEDAVENTENINRTISQSFETSADVAKRVQKEINQEVSEFVKLQSQIGDLGAKVTKLGFEDVNTNQITELKRQIEDLENTYAELMHTFMKKLTVNADVVGVNGFGDKIEAEIEKTENKINELKAAFSDAQNKLANKIKIDIEIGKFDDDISRIDDKFNRLSNASVELRNSIDAVKNALKEMENAATPDEDGVINSERLIKAQTEYAAAIEKTNNLLKIQAREEKAAADAQKLQDNRELFQQKIDTWLKNNSAAVKQFGSSMLELKAKAEACDQVTLNHLESQFKKIDKSAERAGAKGLNTLDKIKAKFKEYSVYFSTAEMFMYAEQGLRDMFEQVKLIDSAMTELKKVTDETDASYNRFLSNAAERAKVIGTTIDGLVDSTAEFAKIGYSFEDSQGLAEVANIYTVVGDNIESAEVATQSLISTMAAFKDEMNGLNNEDFAMSIVDKFNEVSNKYSIGSGGLGEALTRSASSMAAANNTLDETIALITAANEVVKLCHAA